MRIYGIAEIADELGLSRVLVAKWRQRRMLPDPDEELASGPVWLADTIEPWIQERTAKRLTRR